jgi:hypothetical protein
MNVQFFFVGVTGQSSAHLNTKSQPNFLPCRGAIFLEKKIDFFYLQKKNELSKKKINFFFNYIEPPLLLVPGFSIGIA